MKALRWPLRLVCALLLRPAGGISHCERQRLESTEMELYGRLTNRALADLGLGGIYIVHYTKYTDRKEHFKRWLDEQGLQAYFINGWDRQQATDEDIQCMYPSNALFERVALARKFDASWMEVRELTLAMKHASAWYAAVKNKHRHILVFEDDAIMVKDFVERVRKEVLGDASVADNYDVMHLGSFGPEKNPELMNIKGPRFDTTNRGGVAYMVSLNGTEHLMKQTPVLTGTADHMLSNGGAYPNPPPRRWVYRPWIAWQAARDPKHPAFMTDHKNRVYIWTPDLHKCQGILCFLSPKFMGNTTNQIVEGILPGYDSLMFIDGTALPHSKSLALATEARSSKQQRRLRHGSGDTSALAADELVDETTGAAA